MKRWLVGITVLCIICGLALTVFSRWLLTSSAGASWLFEQAASITDLQMSADHIEGRLANELLIDNLVIDLPDGQIAIRKIKVDWDLFSAVNGPFKIDFLEIDQFVIHSFTSAEDTPTDPQVESDDNRPDFSVADLIFLPEWFELEIASLQFNGLVQESPEGSATIFDSLSGAFVWSRQEIVSSDFSYLSPSVDFKGQFDWDLQAPHLEMLADVHLPVELVDQQVLKDVDVPVDFPAKLSLDGDWNAFSGPVSFGVETEDLSRVWLAAEAKGSWQGIYFDQLKGHYLGGRLDGDLDLWWIDFYRMKGQVHVAGLNPGFFLNDLDGLATFDATGELFIPYDENPLTAKVSGKIIEAKLRDVDVSGDMKLDWQEGYLSRIDVDMNSAESRVLVQGEPAERLDVDLFISDLSTVYVDLAGQLESSGWLRWADGYLTGELSGTGSDVVWREASLQSFSYQGSHLAEQAPLAIAVDGVDLRYNDLRADLVHAEVSGSLEEHKLLVTIQEQTGQLTTRLAGRYLDDVWRAQLSTLEGETSALGSWSLVKPATVEWMNGNLSLKDFALVAQSGGQLALGISKLGASANSNLSLDWSDVDHGWLSYLNPEMPVSGNSSGSFQMQLADLQPVALKGRMTGNLSLQNEYSSLDVSSVALEMAWDNSALNLEVLADTKRGEHFELTANSSGPPSWQWPNQQIDLTLNWQDLNLNRLSYLLEGLEIEGRSEGHATLEVINGTLQQAEAEILAEGSMQENSQAVGFRSVNANLHWDKDVLRSEARIIGIHDGLMSLNINSTKSHGFKWPASGDVELTLNDFDLRSIMPFLSSEVALVGSLSGDSSGYWRDDGEVSFRGQIGPGDEALAWQLPDGQIGAVFNHAGLDWQWQGSQLEGQLSLQLASGGDLRGSWHLPLSAHWPLVFRTDGTITANIKGEAQLIEIIPFFASGVFQDIRGKFTSDLNISGSIEDPVFSGTLDLADAAVYVPVTGAAISDLSMNISLQNDKIHLDKLFLKVGEGELSGTGLANFDQWKLEDYLLRLKGDRLHLYDFPELQLFCTPDLIMSGDLTSTTLRGSILIPEMSLIDMSAEVETLPSKDVIIAGEEHLEREKLTFDTDIQVVVELGEDVYVKTEGVEAKLEGGVTIARDEKHHLAGWGEIRLLDGTYKAYGTSLEIKQGLMSYDETPLVNPRLRVFAAKDIGRVQAGVHITGTAENPIVTLASRPAMPERDILGYLFMGRPLNKTGAGGDALAIGAGALMPKYGSTFSDLGIIELDLDGLLNDKGAVRLRRKLSESWEISSTLGTESGVDLYYIFDFD